MLLNTRKMLRRVMSVVINQTRGIKNEVPITWKRPEYIEAYKPYMSGDLEQAPKLPINTTAFQFKYCKELDNAPEAVKTLFSVGNLGQKEKNRLVRKELLERVKRHQYDSTTSEARIAIMTGRIRCQQEHMAKFPKDILCKKIVQELIDKRKKLLKYLRAYDYRRFEWLLERLNIEYKAAPESYHKTTRKEGLRRLTEEHCDSLRHAKFSEYRNLLESQQGPFLKQKLEAFRFIRKEQQELALEVTINEKDIKQVEELLENWTVRKEIKDKAMKKKKK